MSSHLGAIRRVVEAFERSDWTEIDVRSGGVRVHLATGAPSARSTAHDETGGSPPGAAIDDACAAPPAPTPPAAPAPPPGTHVVVAPSPGIFWRAPEPGASPFIALGDLVDASVTVCIVEVMKLMNHLKAGVSGEVVAVYGENGVTVQQGDVLIAIAPSGPS